MRPRGRAKRAAAAPAPGAVPPRCAPLRPAISEPASAPKAEPAPSLACRLRLTAVLAIAPSLPPITGPGECGAPDRGAARSRRPAGQEPGRDHAAGDASLHHGGGDRELGARGGGAARARSRIAARAPSPIFASYDCRGRNRDRRRQALSEHGKGNALDIRALRLADGKLVELTDPQVSQGLSRGRAAERLRALHHRARSRLRRLSREPRPC